MFDALFLFLSDFLLFTPQSYLRLLNHYNHTIWPFQLVALLLGIINLILIKRPLAYGNRLISLSLAFNWLWAGIVFHYYHFTGINWAAPAFALLFILQALLLVIFGALKNNISYQPPKTPAGYTGLLIYLFALVLYPAFTGYLHSGWEKADYYGSSADAACLATLGLLLMANRRSYYLILPLLWCLLSSAMAWLMQSATAPLLFLLGLLVLMLQVTDKRFVR
ncbi:hypothetical protein SG34_007630 [Thalassomonas viridans]|uniref:MFS transporter permease n=1 Tax=Thalassomonas viridans TaxID=137584 RepID=A0AAF0CBN2_9GAMM|nr:DUF6064 family protein [Thalassomonas viridans]WDE06764.1 hypothetical protein SG34_007630 [Thalassomonas viridans]